MTQILQIAIEFFEQNDWPFLRLDREPILQGDFRGGNGEWKCFAYADEEAQRFAFYSVCPISVPEDKIPTAAEFVNRANYALIIGNFELNCENGEVRFKTSIDVEGDRLSTALVERMVVINVAMMDMYLPGIQKVINEGVSPAQAVAEIEGDAEQIDEQSED